MGTADETLIDEIPVTVRLSMGSERLRLFLTGTRMIVAHAGKRGTGALATTSFFGRLSSVVEDLFKGGKESLRKKTLERMSPSEILSADKDNFSIAYDEIVSVSLEKAPYTTLMTILTREEKLEFSTPLGFDELTRALERVLEAKLAIKGAETLNSALGNKGRRTDRKTRPVVRASSRS